jgi:hypothetical protein
MLKLRHQWFRANELLRSEFSGFALGKVSQFGKWKENLFRSVNGFLTLFD